MSSDYIAEIKNYLQTNHLVYIELKNNDDIKMVYDLLVHGKIAENITSATNPIVLIYYGAYFYMAHTSADYIKMKKYYDMAIQQNNAIAMSNIGIYYCFINDTENMMRYYKMAYSHRFDECNLLSNCGLVSGSGPYTAMNSVGNYYYGRSDFVNALKYYQMAGELEPHGGDYLYTIGRCYEQCNDSANMMKYYDMAIELGNKNGLAALISYYRTTDVDKFVAYCKKIIETGNTEYITTLGNYYYDSEQYSAGFKTFMELYKVHHTNITYYLMKFLSRNNTLLTEFIGKHFEQCDIIKTHEETIKTQTEYIEQLELMPEGPKYAEAKAHFNASVELLENITDINL
ncbi:MAG: hypothetical protein Faunusvirus6_21 [Faunusvirus sp.]|uniref:Uncharacterized protein n=1 Tax=Faunusvirus sp. TaxID=2487766 RepID=A0A3G5A081_9VIRU|nr:MAG: hypothetical protein Faunusvirus6_21 [Faunusvirus sp.]